MSGDLHEFFTPIDELRAQEPEFFVPGRPSSPPTPDINVASVSVKTYVGILEEFSKKNRVEQPIYTTLTEERISDFILHRQKCTFRNYSGEGKAKTLKNAKHLAAKEVILKMVDDDKQGILGLSNSKDEAIHFINSLMPEITQEAAQTSTTNENWVGKVSDMCTKEKFPSPTYLDESSGPSNNMVFTVKCTIPFRAGNEKTTEGVGKTKKAAKALAAQSMFNYLNDHLADLHNLVERLNLEDDFDEDQDDENAEQHRLERAMEARVALVEKPMEKLEEIFKKTELFSSYSCAYDIIPRVDIRGQTQCLLTVKFASAAVKAVEAAGGDPHGAVIAEKSVVFPGTGGDEHLAKEDAARAALVLFELVEQEFRQYNASSST